MIMREGRVANHAGAMSNECPYRDKRKRVAWMRGWNEAERERGPFSTRVIHPFMFSGAANDDATNDNLTGE